jgi:RNA polymerase sigma-70 factor (ECF subfamily)
MQPQSNDDAFRDDLVALIPHMRAFARTMCRDYAKAEDLAQDGLAKAWAARASYTPGTNLKAWTFMIMRNQFYSDKRRSWRSTELDPEAAERTLVAIDSPSAVIELDELRRAMAMLPDDQRDALILVGAGGLSYEEAAEICQIAVGTIKSRVSRARDRLALIYAEGIIKNDGRRPSLAMASILSQISSKRAAA